MKKIELFSINIHTLLDETEKGHLEVGISIDMKRTLQADNTADALLLISKRILKELRIDDAIFEKNKDTNPKNNIGNSCFLVATCEFDDSQNLFGNLEERYREGYNRALDQISIINEQYKAKKEDGLLPLLTSNPIDKNSTSSLYVEDKLLLDAFSKICEYKDKKASELEIIIGQGSEKRSLIIDYKLPKATRNPDLKKMVRGKIDGLRNSNHKIVIMSESLSSGDGKFIEVLYKNHSYDQLMVSFVRGDLVAFTLLLIDEYRAKGAAEYELEDLKIIKEGIACSGIQIS